MAPSARVRTPPQSTDLTDVLRDGLAVMRHVLDESRVIAARAVAASRAAIAAARRTREQNHALRTRARATLVDARPAASARGNARWASALSGSWASTARMRGNNRRST